MKKDDKSLVERAKKCLEKYQERESDNILRAEEAIKFRAGEQWPDAVKRDREDPTQDGGARPCPVLDKTNQYVRQIVNEERQNRAAIKIRPVDDEADPKVAEIFTGIIRHIEDRSQAIEAYTTGGEHAIDGGFGYWRLLTEYEDPMSFNQEIRIKRIPNRFSVALGPHTEVDASDCKEALIWEDVPKDDFKAKYPKAKDVDFDDTWGSEELTRVAEYMCIKNETIEIHMQEDGQIVTKDELKGQSLMSRTTQIPKVKWYKLTSAEVLEEKDMIGSYIPVVKVIGNELIMPDGKCRLSGAVEAAMDPQRLHNYAHAGFIENVALAPRAPWLAEEESIEGYEDDYAQANRRNITVLKYRSVSDDQGNQIPMPQRIPPAGISTGWQQMLQNTEHGVESTFGMYGPSVGRQSQEKSGIALQEQKIQGMIGNYHFPDNLARSIQHTGKILLEWIPKIYDTERVARILGEDGTTDMVYLNPEQEGPVTDRTDEMNQKIGSIYNLNIGKYDVSVSTGPSYTSKRQEGNDFMMGLVNARPDLMEVIGDLVFKTADVAYADEIADRLKVLLNPDIQRLIDKDDPIDPKVMAQMKAMEDAGQMLEAKGQALSEAQMELDKQIASTNGEKASIMAERAKLEAQAKILHAQSQEEIAKIRLAERDMIDAIEEEKQKVEDLRRQFEDMQRDAEHEDLMELATVIKDSLSGLNPDTSGLTEQTSQIGQVLTEMASGLNKVNEMEQLIQTMGQHAQSLNDLVQLQSRPKKATMPDGRVFTVTTDQE